MRTIPGKNDRRDEAQYAASDRCKLGDDDAHDLAKRCLNFMIVAARLLAIWFQPA